MKQLLTIGFALLFFVLNLPAQLPAVNNYQDSFRINIVHTRTPVKIDGDLDDSIWMHTEPSSHFFMKFPTDVGAPKMHTEVKVAYDEKYIYAAFKSFYSGKTIIQSLKRDIGQLNNDAVGILLDPLNLHSTGFIFVVNSYNAQSEDQISPFQDMPLTWSWDNKWFSATKRHEEYWTAEMAIPLKTLRYPPGKKIWGVNFMRVDMINNEYSMWTKVPLNFQNHNLGYTGSLVWDNPPPQPGENIVVIPYITGGLNSDKENNEPTKGVFNAGLDSKFTITSSMNLDLTVNPDFSQIEVDQQVTNLTRYDIFLPEKRSFFLENSDIFGEYGIPGFITPFYSRRIGLDKDGNRIPILGGLRLSGNLGSSTRIGVMNMQTGSQGDYHPENYSAISINQNVLARSVIKGYFFNRQGFLSDEDKKNNPLDAWGRNAGGSFDYQTRDGSFGAFMGYNQSFKPGIHGDDKYIETGVSINSRPFTNIFDVASIGTNYYADMGYIQRIENRDDSRDTTVRLGWKHIFDDAIFRFFPRRGPIHTHVFDLTNFFVFNPNYSLNERNNSFKYTANFKNTGIGNITLMNDEVNLLYPISFTDTTPLPAGNYNYSQLTFEYFSDTRKSLSYHLLATGGGFYNGQLYTLVGGITLRRAPHLNLTIQAEYDRIIFPDPYGSTELLLISPRVEINFSTTVSWTTFFQYNTQQNNFNINSRFQYRFKPMSDLYLVYTDNYFTTPFMQNKNRAIVFKLNYWFNL